jgi:hypothetical protein
MADGPSEAELAAAIATALAVRGGDRRCTRDCVVVPQGRVGRQPLPKGAAIDWKALRRQLSAAFGGCDLERRKRFIRVTAEDQLRRQHHAEGGTPGGASSGQRERERETESCSDQAGVWQREGEMEEGEMEQGEGERVGEAKGTASASSRRDGRRGRGR